MERDRTIYSQFCPTVPHINLMGYRLATSSNGCWSKATADRPSGIAHTYTYIEIGMCRVECSFRRSHNALLSTVTIHSLASDCLRRTWNWKNKSSTLLTMMKSQKRTTKNSHSFLRGFDKAKRKERNISYKRNWLRRRSCQERKKERKKETECLFNLFHYHVSGP